MTFYAEYEQDRWLEEHLFRGKHGGVFVEFGAFDGVFHSNTAFFEGERNWSGVLVEANPVMFTRLLASGRHAAKVLGAVGAEFGIAEFTAVEGTAGWSGIWDHMDLRHRERIGSAVVQRYCVPTMPLAAILDRHGLVDIDLLSVDVEGAEFAILEALDFSRYRIAVLMVENNYGDPAVERMLAASGYRKIARLVIDDIYERTS